MISLLTQNLFNNSADVSRISFKFDTQTLKTTTKIFHSNIFKVASLLLDYFVKLRLNLSTNGMDGVLRNALRISFICSMVKLEKNLVRQCCQALLTEVADKK